MSVGIVTGCRLDGLMYEPWWEARPFLICTSLQTGRRAHPATCTVTLVFFPAGDASGACLTSSAYAVCFCMP